jgi:hypothetical protein
MEMLQISGTWTEHFPRVAAWFERCRARPSFTEAIERHIPAAAHDSYRAAGTPTWPVVRAKFAQVLTEI